MKGRAMFLAAAEDWHDPAVSRRIGGLLGNDLGQMRIQFDAKAYIVEPAYRDDNLGLWVPAAAPPAADSETILEAARAEKSETEPPRMGFPDPPGPAELDDVAGLQAETRRQGRY